MEGKYRHSKTGNIYDYLTLVNPVTHIDKPYMVFTAHCSEDKDVKVKIHAKDGYFSYIPDKNPFLHDRYSPKVLYERDGVLWLRSESEFHGLIDVNGLLVPRFVPLAVLV